MRKKKAFVTGKCKKQTKALKRSVDRLKQAFDALLRGVLPASTGSFEPKWDEKWVLRLCAHQYSAQAG
ncbi:hypothetical protein [Pseudomonas sp. Y24-6]|uniref:hypothetical protein n=1 Tax=Pseudomonas sp. Y24-6 TaxID=2750013 RepID=UPI0013CF2599|nr:hypothetical protein [Pseudomonas sp. Y24-6]MCA4962166.1 hypothetical protein [Pseudomonas sp. Y24-6]